MSRELTTEEILDGKTPEDIEAMEAAKPTVNTPTGIPGDALEFSKIEVGGIIKDNFGNEWQVPADNVEDYDDLHAADLYANLPEELTNVFDVVGVPTAKIKDWMQRQYAPVFQSEIGLTEEMRRFAGSPTDSVHTLGDMTLMKIPKVINARRQAVKVKETKRRLDAIEPTAEMIKKANESGIMTRVERKIAQTVGPQDSLIIGDK